MKKFIITLIALLSLALPALAENTCGLVAVKTDEGVFLSWNMTGEGNEYAIYRGDEKIAETALTNYTDVGADGSEKYRIDSFAPVSVWDKQYLEIPINVPKATKEGVSYSANDASVGDLDGDGEYEIVLKWDPSDSKDSSNNGTTDKVYIDAYKMDGTMLWRIDLGVNIRAGAHDTQFLVYDLDGDGCAEVAFRTADGVIDGQGNVIGDPNAVWTNNWSGKNLEGPLWVSVFEGKSGKELARTPFDPQSTEPSTLIFGDDYGNRSERYNACIAYLDGENPYMVFQRGYYGGRADKGPGRTVIAAYSYKDGKIEKLWRFDTMDEGNEQYIGQGNHNISVGDADGDGKDEIFTGSLTLDHNGDVLWCSFMGHGDAMHLGDFDPDREGLEFFAVHEDSTKNQSFGFTVFDAATGEVLQSRSAGKDTGRGVIANVGPFGGNYVAWAGAGAGKVNSLGEDCGNLEFNSMNFRIYWDGDLYDELLDGTCIFKVNSEGKQETIFDSSKDGCVSNNGTKSNPCLQADILGDWREEVIWRTADSSALRIYTTTIPTEFSIMPLMTDHVYEMGVVWQNSSYNQPPHLGYYLGGIVELTIDSDTAKVNGQTLPLDSAAYISNGRTMVPLRFIAEAMGANVSYEDETVTVKSSNKTITMKIGSEEYSVNGEKKSLDSATEISNDRTMVPVRAIAEALGMSVLWDDAQKKVTVKRGEEQSVNENEDKNVKIFIAGDSTAQSYRDNMAPQAGWGQMLNLFFDDSVTIVNRAMAGRSLKSFFNEGRWTSILEEAQQGDYVIIQFGQNEGAWNKPERYISHEDFAVMLEEEYIKPALEKGLIPVIATQTQGHWFDANTNLIGEESDNVSYASLLRDAAEKYNLTLLEVYGKSRALENKMGEEESRKLHLYAEPGEYDKYPDGVSDNTHFSYYGAFEIARIVAQELEQIDDLKERRIDEDVQISSFDGEYTFDVRQYLNKAQEISVAIRSEDGAEVSVNGSTVLSKSCTDREFVTYIPIGDGKITVKSSAFATVEVSPVWEVTEEGGIDTAKEELFLDIPDGEYDFTFEKLDNERGNIYINSLLVGANVDMYGTVGVPEGTVYKYKGFEVTNGAKITVNQRTSSLKSVKASKTPSIFDRKTRIFVGGDSTLCNYYPKIPSLPESEIAGGTVRTGWAQLLDRFVSDEYEVVNLASSGDWAKDWKDCIFPTVEEEGKEGDVLIIQFGINDRNRDDKKTETMKDALKYMIEECRKKGITPILVKPQPSVGYSWGSAGDFEKPNGNNGGFFDAVWEVAEETNCDYVDLYSLAAEHFAEVGRDYVSRNYQLWNSEKDEIEDKLHISFAGAKKICSLFAEEAERQGLLKTDGYYSVTKIDSDVYLFENGEKAKIYNDSDEYKDVTVGNETVTIAPRFEVNIKNAGDMSVKASSVKKSATALSYYVIKNVGTGKALAVVDGTLKAVDEENASTWYLKQIGGNDTYALQETESRKVIDVPALSTESGVSLIVYSANYGDNQKWTTSETEDGYFTIVSRSSQLYMEQSDEGVIQNSASGSDNQKWQIVEVEKNEN